MIWFTALLCEFVLDEVTNVLSFILAEFADGSGSRLVLERAGDFDAQARALGTDTYRMIIDNESAVYGCVSGWHIDAADVLHISLEPGATASTGARTLEIALVLEPGPRTASHAMSVLLI